MGAGMSPLGGKQEPVSLRVLAKDAREAIKHLPLPLFRDDWCVGAAQGFCVADRNHRGHATPSVRTLSGD